MDIRLLTKQEVQKVYKAMEQLIAEMTGVTEFESEHVEGILIIGFRDDNTYSETNIGKIQFGRLLDAFSQIAELFYKQKPEEKPKLAT